MQNFIPCDVQLQTSETMPGEIFNFIFFETVILQNINLTNAKSNSSTSGGGEKNMYTQKINTCIRNKKYQPELEA